MFPSLLQLSHHVQYHDYTKHGDIPAKIVLFCIFVELFWKSTGFVFSCRSLQVLFVLKWQQYKYEAFPTLALWMLLCRTSCDSFLPTKCFILFWWGIKLTHSLVAALALECVLLIPLNPRARPYWQNGWDVVTFYFSGWNRRSMTFVLSVMQHWWHYVKRRPSTELTWKIFSIALTVSRVVQWYSSAKIDSELMNWHRRTNGFLSNCFRLPFNAVCVGHVMSKT